MLKKVSVLIVVTNEEQHLKRHFNALKNQTYKNFNVYILDNNSIDNSVKLIKELYPDARITHSNENTGFAKGNNIIADKAFKDGADYLFVVNPDIELHQRCIEELVILSESDSKTGIVGPIMFYGLEQKEQLVIQCYEDRVNFSTCHTYSPQALMKFKASAFPEKIKVRLVSGGIIFMKAELYSKIGLFEEDYFIYNDEVDLAFRVSKTPFEMFITSKAMVWHHHNFGKKNKFQNRFMYYYMNRNIILFFKKFGLYHLVIWYILKSIFIMPLRLRWAIRESDVPLFKYCYLGLINGLIGEKGKTTLNFHD